MQRRHHNLTTTFSPPARRRRPSAARALPLAAALPVLSALQGFSALSAAWAPSAPARAQPVLDLAPPAAPAPNSGQAALTLARRLEEDADRRAQAAALAVDASPATFVRADAPVRYRRLIAALLRQGEAMGPRGSTHILSAFTLYRGLNAWDEFTSGADEADHAPRTAALLAFSDAASDASLQRVPPDEAELREWLRSALAPASRVLHAPGASSSAGASYDGGAPSPWMPALQPASPAEIDLARSTMGLAAEGLTWPAYAGETHALLEIVRSASRVRDADWAPFLPPPQRSGLVALYDGSLAALAADAALDADSGDVASRAAALRQLHRLSLFAGLASSLGAETGRAPADAAARAGLTALADALISGAGPGLDAALASAWRSAGSIERSALAGAMEPAMTREVRSAAVALRRRADAAGDLARADLPRLLGDASPLTCPALLAVQTAADAAEDDREALALLARAAADPDGRGLYARLLKISSQLARDDLRDSALPALRTLAQQARLALEHPGEARLGSASVPGSPWHALTGGKAPEIERTLSALRRRWRDMAAEGNDVESALAARRLGLVRDLLSLLEDASALAAEATGGPASDADAFAGWELSGRAKRALTQGLDARCAQATAAVLADFPDAQARLDRALSPAARLAGRMERLLSGMPGAGGIAEAASVPPLAVDAGAPLPPLAWMPEPGRTLVLVRDDLAAVCRYLEEFADAAAAQDAERARVFLDYADLRAAEVLKRLPTDAGR